MSLSKLLNVSARAASRAFATVAAPGPEVVNRYKRLLYQSQQRGWLELDLIIGSWAQRNKDRLIAQPALMDKVEVICAEENSDLMRWFCEGKPVPDKYAADEIMADMLAYAQSPNKPWAPRPGQGNQ